MNYTEYYLAHHGIKGQKWGKRRFQNKDGSLTPAGEKRYTKADYKRDKKNATEKYKNAIKNADAQYEQTMEAKRDALREVNKKYDIRDAETEKHYESQIRKHRQDAEKAKAEMDFWGESDGFLYQDAKAKYDDSSAKIRDLETRREGVRIANKFERDNATIKVRELFADSSEKASATRAAAYAQAGKDYMESLASAKKAYKDAKKSK